MHGVLGRGNLSRGWSRYSGARPQTHSYRRVLQEPHPGICLPRPTLGSTQRSMECHREHLGEGSGPASCTQVPGARCEAGPTARGLPPSASAWLHQSFEQGTDVIRSVFHKGHRSFCRRVEMVAVVVFKLWSEL